MVIRELLIRLGFKLDRNQAKKADSAITKLKKGLASLGLAIGALQLGRFIAGAVSGFVRLGDTIAKTADKLGVGVEQLQELRFAAERTGVPVRALDVGLQRFIRRSGEFAQGTGEAKKAFEALGISARDSNGQIKSTDQLLNEVADGLAGVENQSEKVALAFKFFDTEGVALVNTLGRGSAELEAMRQRARDLGGILSEEDARAAEEFSDAMLDLRFQFRQITFAFAKAFLPAIRQVTDEFMALVGENAAFIKLAFDGFLKNIIRLLGSVIRLFIRLGRFFGDLLDEFADAEQGLNRILLLIGVVIAFFALLAAPMGVVLFLLIALIDDILTFQEGGVSAIGRVISAWEDLVERLGLFGQVLDTIVVAFSSTMGVIRDILFTLINLIGNLLAGNIEAAFTELEQNLRTTFSNLFDALVEKANELGRAIVSVLPEPVIRFLARFGKFSQTGFAAGPQVIAGSAGSGGVTANQSNAVNVTVNAAPGMSEQDLANAATRQITAAQEAQNRQLMDALAPGAP